MGLERRAQSTLSCHREGKSLRGDTFCRIWLPDCNLIARVSALSLKPIPSSLTSSADGIAFVAAAARVADALTQQNVLLAPIETTVIPLPHQLKALGRALATERVRYLLADEVGLGKTIEAGLILRELKLRGLAKRILVIAPKGLSSQWVSEMRFHFGETFQLVLPEDLQALKRFAGATFKNADKRAADGPTENPWQTFTQIVVPMDSVKPLDKRRGWTAAELAEHNRERFEDLISAGWDLVIVDEAHRLSGSTDQVARYKLGQGLSEAAPYLLLLSATPHQGKTDAFQRMVSLIDPHEFADVASVTREKVQNYVIRTEKKNAIDAEGNPLFKPRRTQLVPVTWDQKHREQELLYTAVTEYVKLGYNQAIREKKSYIGFLMILMQRLVVSSTKAIRTTLEKRLEALLEPQEQLSLFPQYSEDEWADLDGQEQIQELLRTRLSGLKNERAEVKLLLEAATRCDQAGPDAKAEALLDWIYRLQSEENEPELKVLVFTEFVPTQEMLAQFLADRGFSVVRLNGSMDMEERKAVQQGFATNARILISTDAGGEGLNLQFCHVVVNYDIPWNPMRLEQRIGRVDRIGQKKVVRAINFVFNGSVEHRVREVLEKKLAIIFEEFGIDKTGDVLDSGQAGQMFDAIYVDAILNPKKVDSSVTGLVTKVKEQFREAQEAGSLLGSSETLNPKVAQEWRSHPLPHWIERMTVRYLKTNGGSAFGDGAWDLTWPDGTAIQNVVFSSREAEKFPGAQHITLEDQRIRDLVTQLPRFVPGQPVPVVHLNGISKDVRGIWSLWEIGLAAADLKRRKIMSLFVSDEGKSLIPTARRIWDQLLVSDVEVQAILPQDESLKVFSGAQCEAEKHGQALYESLVNDLKSNLLREREKAAYAFAMRRKRIEKIGLPDVRTHRLNVLAQEERDQISKLDGASSALPEMIPLVLLRVEGISNE